MDAESLALKAIGELTTLKNIFDGYDESTVRSIAFVNGVTDTVVIEKAIKIVKRDFPTVWGFSLERANFYGE